MPPTGYLAHNPGMCPDQELNQRSFSSQDSTQSTELHQPGQTYFFLRGKEIISGLKKPGNYHPLKFVTAYRGDNLGQRRPWTQEKTPI